MKSSTSVNLLNQYLVNKAHSLGKGATGEVYLGKSLKDKIDVAVKIIDIKTIDNEVTQYLLEMEKIALMTVVNPHILRGLKVIQNNHFCYLITELCNGGSLKTCIKVNGSLGEEKSLNFLIEILKGECSLIGKGIIHRDLKPANILLHNGQVKIIDFGYSEIKGHKKPNLQYNVGSPSYMSPEAFLRNQYSEKSQIWAIGVTFYECLNGKTFDEGKNMAEVYRQIKKYGIPYKVEVSDKCKNIIKWCLEQDPKKRPTCLELLNSIVSPEQTQQASKVNAVRPVRVSFGQLDNIQIKSNLFDKRASLKMQDYTLFSQNIRKEQIIKPMTSQSKRPIYSSYEQNKFVMEKRPPLQAKPSVYYATKTKYDNFVQFKPSQLRQKSQLFQSQNNPNAYLTTRQKSRETYFGCNPIRSKIFSKPNQHHRVGSINYDYFGQSTER